MNKKTKGEERILKDNDEKKMNEKANKLMNHERRRRRC